MKFKNFNIFIILVIMSSSLSIAAPNTNFKQFGDESNIQSDIEDELILDYNKINDNISLTSTEKSKLMTNTYEQKQIIRSIENLEKYGNDIDRQYLKQLRIRLINLNQNTTMTQKEYDEELKNINNELLNIKENMNGKNDKELLIEDAGLTFDLDDKVIIDVESTKKDLELIQQTNKTVYKKVFVFTDNKKFLESIENLEIISSYDNGYLVLIPTNKMGELASSKEIEKVVDEQSIKTYTKEEQLRIGKDYENLSIDQTKLEVKPSEIEKAKEEGRKKLVELGANTSNPYSYYFIDIDKMPKVYTLEKAYSEAAGIIYLHDIDLWGVNEKWVSPNVVFDETPSMKTNPTSLPVSDCEEHAISFVAMCRAMGIDPENVRVATGYVEINGEKFGHAWCQLKINDKWLNVEPTSGSYVNEKGNVVESSGLGLYYYNTKIYPSLEIWSYFNDQYYIDSTGGNAPSDWKITETAYAVSGSFEPSIQGYISNLINFLQAVIYSLLN